MSIVIGNNESVFLAGFWQDDAYTLGGITGVSTAGWWIDTPETITWTETISLLSSISTLVETKSTINQGTSMVTNFTTIIRSKSRFH